MKSAAIAGLLLVALPVQSGATECGMTPAFEQPNRNVKSKSTQVWSESDGNALLFTVPLNVNTDGARRSYSVDDFWGEKRALNNLCNAMSDACGGLDNQQLGERRLATQQAMQNGWPADQLKATQIDPGIIPFKDGKPCPEIDGFLPSATALQKPHPTDVCDITNYVDALEVPAFVLPGKNSEFAARGAGVGDLIVAIAPGSKTPVFGVVGDTGPRNALGEGSIALNGELLQKREEPKNYGQVKREWVVPAATILIFPKSRDVATPYLMRDRIDPSAMGRLQSWGGAERLAACATEHGRP